MCIIMDTLGSQGPVHGWRRVLKVQGSSYKKIFSEYKDMNVAQRTRHGIFIVYLTSRWGYRCHYTIVNISYGYQGYEHGLKRNEKIQII